MAKVKTPVRRRACNGPRRCTSKRKQSGPMHAPAAAEAAEIAGEDQVITSNLSLHELFQQQARAMIERADLDEDQKQTMLVAMSCPCCGAGAMSFTAKLRR